MEAWKEELYHHGILGMRWGKRNGPPYPLGVSDHSASEKKAGWRKSLDGGGTSPSLHSNKKALTNSNSSRYSSKQIQDYRKEMMNKYKNDPDKRALYKNATDEQIEADIHRKEVIKKAIVYGAAAVGIAAASYMVYKGVTTQNAQVLTGLKDAGIKPTVDILQKNGYSLNTAQKLVEISKDTSLDDVDIIRKISNEVSLHDMDISLEKGFKLTRVDFHKDFNMKAVGKNPLFVTMNKVDHNIYKQVLPNRTGGNDGRFEIILEATKSIKAPSYEKTEKIISDLIAKDPKFKSQIRDNISDMIQKNLKQQGITIKGLQLQMIVDRNMQILSQKGDAYVAITALGGNAVPEMKTKFAKAFMKAGYQAIIDMHDVKDGLSNIPLIMLDNSTLTKVGQKMVARM